MSKTKCKECEEKNTRKNKVVVLQELNEKQKETVIKITNKKTKLSEADKTKITELLKLSTGINLKTCKKCSDVVWKFWLNKVKETIKCECND